MGTWDDGTLRNHIHANDHQSNSPLLFKQFNYLERKPSFISQFNFEIRTLIPSNNSNKTSTTHRTQQVMVLLDLDHLDHFWKHCLNCLNLSVRSYNPRTLPGQ